MCKANSLEPIQGFLAFQVEWKKVGNIELLQFNLRQSQQPEAPLEPAQVPISKT